MFYIDESGSMPTFRDMRYKNRYFVIAFVHTNDPRHLKSTFKRAMSKLRRDFPDFFANLKDSRECKGSEMLPFMKAYLLEKIINTTDVRIGHMVVDNTEIAQKFRDKPGRSFNYLIKIIMENFNLSPQDIQCLRLNIDNRNTALEGLSELEGYLYNELVLEKGIINEAKVHYHESCDNFNIQVADLIANVIYQRFRYKGLGFPNYVDVKADDFKYHPYTFEYLYQYIKPKIVVPFVYPVRNDLIMQAGATFEL
jgi:hypothetical protein